jgi:acyl-CoA synthetase (NDP forming)
MSLLPPTIIRELELERHGYKIYPMGPYYQAFREGGSIKLYADDAKRNHEDLGEQAAGYADLAGRLGRRVLVCAAARPGVELALGIVRDPYLGPLIVVGAGGILVELLADRVVALPPVSAAAGGALC